MTLTLRFAAVLGLLSLPLVYADQAQYRIFHRLYHPIETQGTFQERGLVSIAEDNTVSFQFASTFAEDVSSFAEDLQTIKDKDLLLYQVALEHEGDITEAQWDVSSVKACHLAGSISEQIYLHIADTQSPKPYAINYFVSPIPHGGACPKSRSKKSSGKVASFESFLQVNTTVILKGPHVPPFPQLASPPPITPQGEPVAALPEKTFLERNWMYIVGILLVLMLMGGDEERPKK
ncbi:hypothetical protein C0991_012039 [Blastosporella zonata]|nr:hypothetical protein C0991_012039 [Blastosporella zonata]